MHVPSAHHTPYSSSPESTDMQDQHGDLSQYIQQHNLLAPLHGFRYLLHAIDTAGLQSEVSSHPDFPSGRTVSIRKILQAQLSSQARAKFSEFGTSLSETFTAMMALKLLGSALGNAATPLIRTAASARMQQVPRYRFFSRPEALAPDIDCTAVSLVGLYDVGAIDRNELRLGAEELLRSAAAESLSSGQNRAFGKENGQLIHGVFKVYWDDDLLDRSELRGCKHDPTCVANALHAVFFAARHAGLRLHGVTRVVEVREDGSRVTSTIDRRVIIERNLAYLASCLDRSTFADGTRYYPSPDAFLCFASELVRDFPREAEPLRGPLLEALSVRWHTENTDGNDPANTGSPINLAMRIVAAQNVGVRESVLQSAKDTLRGMQCESGAWAAGAFFKLGSMKYYFGSEAMTTIFAVRALLGHHSLYDDSIQ